MEDIFHRYADLARKERLLPVKVTAIYRRLVQREQERLGRPGGPIYRIAYPIEERFATRAPGEVADFVDDRSNMPAGTGNAVIRKYRDRLLFLITDRCAGHCMYCFRQDVLTESKDVTHDAFEAKLQALIRYVRSESEIEEVILSGGDPLTIGFDLLKSTLERVASETHVRSFRVHTRNAVFAPHSLSAQVCDLFAKFDVRLVLHIVHPYELQEEPRAAIERAVAASVRCYAQFPILRGVNDHPDVLILLLRELESLRVRPLTMFIPDPVNYSAAYRIGLRRLLAIVRDVHVSTPSWINAVRVVLDTPRGKVRPHDIVEWRDAEGIVVFQRDGEFVRYPDLPAEMDVPGTIETMLWDQATG